ncbi:hypothetical protein [Paenibacillus sp. 2TAB19]|uniref:hypothetical protein n=1 Tax=Paenibacillus sp. 2TAB19 TaxID=3233003 RepID=UPI003F9900B0
MKKRRSMVMVAPGKDVTLYIPTDTPPEVIRYLNRLKAEGIFSQGIMDILIGHILGQQEAVATSAIEEAAIQGDDLPNESIEESNEIPDTVHRGDVAQVVQKPFSPQDILRQAARNAGKLLHDRQ